MKRLSCVFPPRRLLKRPFSDRRGPVFSGLVAGGLLLSPGLCGFAQAERLVADLDVLVTWPDAYLLTPDDLEERFPQGSWNQNPYFKWLAEDRSRAIFQRKEQPSLTVDLALLGGTVPVEEAVVDFEDGKFLGITVSIYNRGDGRSISEEEFQDRYREMGRHLGEALAVRPTRRDSRPSHGLLTDGWMWISARGKAVLEHNAEAPPKGNGNIEFLRMRLARRDAGGVYEAATQERSAAAVRLSELPRNLKRSDEGDVYIPNVPMVDQGAKGYCVVASVQRLFEYYGIPADMHQLAQITGADPDRGTSPLETTRELRAVDYRFRTRFECHAVRHGSGLVQLVDNQYVGKEVPEAQFHRIVKRSIDEGIPVLWALELGLFPEEPPSRIQTGGGHMRLLIGYNEDSNRYVFTDSWGAGHEFKTMDADDAYRATLGVFTLKPTVR